MTVQYKSYLFVTAQFALLFAIVLSSGTPTTYLLQTIGLWLLSAGLAICIVAIWQLRSYSLTALPTPVKNAKLLETGLYTHVRHPIYSGLMLLMSGVVVARYSIVRLILLIGLVFLLYEKSKFEELQLIEKFGKHYKAYQSKTHRFIYML